MKLRLSASSYQADRTSEPGIWGCVKFILYVMVACLLARAGLIVTAPRPYPCNQDTHQDGTCARSFRWAGLRPAHSAGALDCAEVKRSLQETHTKRSAEKRSLWTCSIGK